MGAGWNEAEHQRYGFPFPRTRERMDVFAEQLVEIVHRSLRADPFSFDGEHYRLEDANPQPKPVQSRLPIIVGGRATAAQRGSRRALGRRVTHAVLHPSPDECRALGERIAKALRARGARPAVRSR